MECNDRYCMPRKDLEKSFLETNEIAIKWLKVGAEGGVPESMFLLGVKIQHFETGVDKRVGHYWVTEAHRTGKMDYLMDVLQRGLMGIHFDLEFVSIVAEMEGEYTESQSQSETQSELIKGLNQPSLLELV